MSNRKTIPYIIKTTDPDVARFPSLVYLTLSFSLMRFLFSFSGAAADVRLAG